MPHMQRKCLSAYDKALKTNNVADNLLQRGFGSYGPRMILLTDITYLPYNGIFTYLSTYWMPLQSRCWHMGGWIDGGGLRAWDSKHPHQ